MPIAALSIRAASRRLLGALLLLTACTQAMAQENLLGRALEDLQAGNPQVAFDRLAPEQSRRAGDPDFDYLLGVSALGVGRNTEAIFALERVLALRPADVNARVAMGRAHLALQETDAARREFSMAQTLDGSEGTRAAVQRYLTLTDQLEAAARFSAQMFLEFSMGYDSNVNSASAVSQVAIPALGGLNFTIGATSLPQKDGFLSLSGGVNIRNRLSPRTALIGGLALSQRLYFHETQYETETLDMSVGLAHTRGLNQYVANLQASQIHVNHPDYAQGYRDSVGATMQWARSLGSNAQWSNYYQIAVLDYPGQEPRDTLRQVLGAAFAKGLDSGLSGYLGLYGGIEKEEKSQNAAFGHKLAGLRLGVDYPVSNRLGLFAMAAYEYRSYRGEDASFLVSRRDRQYSAGVGLHFALPAKGWRLSPQLSYMDVDSNIPINRYDRWLAQVTFRGEF